VGPYGESEPYPRSKRCLPISQLTRTLGPALAALLLALSACGSDDESGKDAAASEESSSADSGSESESSQDEQDSGPQPNLDEIPDVVAEVNGTEIAKDQFVDAYTPQYQQMAMQSQASGEKVDEKGLQKQVVDNLVNTELLVQEADSRGIEASQEQTDETLTSLAQQNGMKSSDEFVAALEKQGMDPETIESQVQDQVVIEELLAEEAGDTEPTEQELRALYKTLKTQQAQAGGKGQKVPPFNKVKPQLEDQLKSQKESEVAGGLIDSLRKDADIEIHI
jgi:peptidyl-prolyl cis-trans isomerase SurA